MKIKILPALLLFIISIICFQGCDDINSGPEIEWIADNGSMTYSYSGGVVSGVSIYKKFNVVGEKSGEIKINAECGNLKKSSVAFVESGNQYKVKVTCGLGKKGSSSTITLDSPTVSEPFKITISGYSVNLNGIEIK